MSIDAPDYHALVEQHDRRLFGYFRARVGGDQIAHDLAQDTWAEVWPRVETFDPEIASFWRFTKNWAEIVLKRHWSGRSAIPIRWPSGEDDEGSASEVENQAADGLPLEVCLELSKALLDLLQVSMSCDRPPHEIVVFGFSKLRWKPVEIVDELSEDSVADLGRRLEVDYSELVTSPDLGKVFEPLHAKMELQITDLVRDRRTKKAYAHVPKQKTGGMSLATYFSPDGDPKVLVTRWWDTVRRAVFRQIQRDKPGALSALLAESTDETSEGRSR